MGRNPAELAEVTAPVIDLFPLLASQKIQFARNTGALTNTGQSAAIVVPVGEIWIPLVFQAGISSHASVGTECALAIRMTDMQNAVAAAPRIWIAEQDVKTSIAVNQRQYLIYSPPRPWVIHGDTIIDVYTNLYISGATGSDSFEIEVMYYKLTV